MICCRRLRAFPPGPHRSGYSLIELTVVIAVMGGLLSFLGLVMHTLFLTEQHARRMEETQRTLFELEQRLRADVGESQQAELDLNRQQLVLHRTDGYAIRYTLGQSRALRERVSSNEEVQHRDLFVLRDGELHWTEPDAVAEGIVHLTVTVPADTISGPVDDRPLQSLEIRTSLPRFVRNLTTTTTAIPQDRRLISEKAE